MVAGGHGPPFCGLFAVLMTHLHVKDNSTGGSYAYRASKAAVNSIGKSLACDLASQGIVVSLLHPGVTKTNMNPAADTDPEAVEAEEAAAKLVSRDRCLVRRLMDGD
jgi:NAD(P)-dependent dehydrogenase (short-subunit alcohol dehydrogenase family)